MPVASDSNDDHHLCNVTTFFCTPTFSFSVSQRVFNAVSTFAHTLNIFLQCSSCNYRQCQWWLMVLRLNNVIRGKTTLFVSLEHPRASHTNFHSTISQGNARALFFIFQWQWLFNDDSWLGGRMPATAQIETLFFDFFSGSITSQLSEKVFNFNFAEPTHHQKTRWGKVKTAKLSEGRKRRKINILLVSLRSVAVVGFWRNFPSRETHGLTK